MLTKIRYYFKILLKGFGMGAANVIPGVSGGTIALITNIYEELINSLKNFDFKALNYLLTFRWKKFAEHTNLFFIIAVFLGSILSVFSIARLFEYLLVHEPILIWSAYPGSEADLSATNLSSLVITAELDGVINKGRLQERKELLPTASKWVEIQGGNHAQFGYYGFQRGDKEAKIKRETQLRSAAEEIIEFIGS